MVENQDVNAPEIAPVSGDNGSAPSQESSIRSEIDSAKAKLLGREPKGQDQPKVPAPAEKLGEAEGGEATQDKAKAPAGEIPQPSSRNPRDVKSIGKLTAVKHQLKAENAQLKAEIAELRKMQGAAPKAADFESPEDFQSAKIEHNLEMKQAQRALEQKSSELQQRESQEWTERCRSLTQDFDGFSKAYTQHYEWLAQAQPEMLEFAAQSTVGPVILENAFKSLFADAAEYERWMSLTPAGRRHELVLAEQAITQAFGARSAPAAKPAALVMSRAPAPIAPDGNKAPVDSGSSLRAQIEASKRRQMGL